MIYVFDLDGTLSIVGDRIKYLQQDKKDWDSFYKACGEDAVNENVAKLYHVLDIRYDVRVVTGRREEERDKTLDWFSDNGFYQPYLYMRESGDKRPDTEVKPELVKDFMDDIVMVFEDRGIMVEKWRELGLTCCQVSEGKY